jgi:hypothetical protein
MADVGPLPLNTGLIVLGTKHFFPVRLMALGLDGVLIAHSWVAQPFVEESPFLQFLKTTLVDPW